MSDVLCNFPWLDLSCGDVCSIQHTATATWSKLSNRGMHSASCLYHIFCSVNKINYETLSNTLHYRISIIFEQFPKYQNTSKSLGMYVNICLLLRTQTKIFLNTKKVMFSPYAFLILQWQRHPGLKSHRIWIYKSLLYLGNSY